MTSQEADYVILEGGTAGIALAARLSEDPTVSVLVLEAGEYLKDDPRVKTPALWPGLLGTDADWNFTSVPQKALYDKVIPIPHGRILGGSSAVNGMAFIGNSKVNVDAWAQLGNPDWTWEIMEPYYNKTYTMSIPSKAVQENLGLGYISEQSKAPKGPIQLSFPDAIDDPVASAWITSFRNFGYLMTTDPFSGTAFGGYTNAAAIDGLTKTRSYAASAYYEPVKGRSNLTVITKAHVTRVTFANDTMNSVPTATGVAYDKESQIYKVTARREVIVSSGAFHSPKILELSGIGAKSILDAHGIPVVYDNPGVGENLQDHILAGMSFEVRDSITTKDGLMRREPEAMKSAVENYKTKQFGPFTVGGNYSSALLPLPEYTSVEGRKELEALIASVPPQSPFERDLQSYVRSVLYNPDEASGGFFTYPAQADFRGSGTAAEVVKTKFQENYITICASFLHPLSRGSTHIKSADPEDKPVIDPKYLTNPVDLDALARHTRFIEDIVETPEMQTIIKPGGKRSPGAPADLRKISHDELKDYVRHAAKSTWHPVGTCAMMPLEKGGVVDPKLRVYGVDKLRVVDASVIPIITRGNTQMSVYAVAERAADLIRGC